MYISPKIGIVELSYQQAINTLHTAINARQTADYEIYRCLKAIQQYIEFDPVARLYTLYLIIIQQVKANQFDDLESKKFIACTPTAIAANLESATLAFIALSSDDQQKAAPYLIGSGAYNALLPLAKVNTQIARILGDAAAAHIQAGSPESNYHEALQIGAHAYKKKSGMAKKTPAQH